MLQRSLRKSLTSKQASIFVIVAAICSYPILFCLERGNLEMVLAIGIAVGVWAYVTGRRTLAALLWGLFGSVKLYPLILVALFLSERDYRRIAITAITTTVITLFSLWYVGPTTRIAAAGIRQGTHAFLYFYSLRLFSPEWDHSLFCLLKIPAHAMHLPFHALLKTYLVTVGLMMLTLYFVRIRKLPMLNQVTILLVSSVLIPPTSFDYTLVQLYAAWATLVLVTATHKEALRGTTAAMVLFALLFTPSNLVTWSGHQYNGQFKCFLLLGLLYVASRYPWPNTSAQFISRTSSQLSLN